MKKYNCILIVALFILNSSFAQPIPRQSIEDSMIGWMKVYNFKGVREPLKVDDKLYSAAQLSICDSFANWMQASYMPKGGLGEIRKGVSTKLGLYNQNDAALPQTYGAHARTYVNLRYNSSHKLELVTSDHEEWSVMANEVPGFAADIFCTPTQYYFTLPSFEEQGYGTDVPKPYGLTTHPNVKKYYSYFKRNSVMGNEKIIVLCKDNKLPFVRISRGEYLQITEAAINRVYEKEKKKILEENKGDQRGIDYFMKYLNDKNEKRIAVLKNNKEKYKSRLQEAAEIFTIEPDAFLENYPDVFEGSGAGRLRLPVYKLDPVMAELCKKDKPQWIKVTWHGDLVDPIGKHEHESVINNFNFEYVYNFFFDPEKIKGQPYKPLRSPLYKEAVVIAEASENSKKNTADKNIYFFDDFSTTAIGKKPIGWKTTLTFNGNFSVVTKLDGLEGNWAMMGGNYTIATNLIKKPFPQNFTLSYDVIAAQNFTWGAKGLTFLLSKETSPGNAESFLRFKIRPGYDGREGDAELETNITTPPGYLNGSKSLAAPGFSNNKKINRITVTIKKMEESVQVFIDKNKIADYPKAIPSALLFNVMSFAVLGGSGENDNFYISNIKITKD